MGRAYAREDDRWFSDIKLRLERGRVPQPRFAILRCAKLKKPANIAAKGTRLALDRQRSHHEAQLGLLAGQIEHERIKRREVLSGDLEETLHDLREKNRELKEQVSDLEGERDRWKDKAHERKKRHILTVERALDFAQAHGIEPEDMAAYLKHGRNPHEKVHERDREKDLDLDLD